MAAKKMKVIAHIEKGVVGPCRRGDSEIIQYQIDSTQNTLVVTPGEMISAVSYTHLTLPTTPYV